MPDSKWSPVLATLPPEFRPSRSSIVGVENLLLRIDADGNITASKVERDA